MKMRWPGFVLIVALLAVWQFVTSMKLIDAVSLPKVSTIMIAGYEGIMGGKLLKELLPSIQRILISFSLATVVAVPIGLLMGTNRWCYRLLEPLMEFVRPIPSSAYIPVAILFLGIGEEMKIFVVFMACFFPILLNTYSGVLAVDPILKDTGKTFGVTGWRAIWQITLPDATPSILTGMRISLGIALIVVVVAEMISSNSGIGFYILDQQRTFHVPEMFVGIFTLGLLGYLMNAIFLKAESYILRWRLTESRN
jgi:ABC-type nitrate/sulfonate/bicarbonate transport system permease component